MGTDLALLFARYTHGLSGNQDFATTPTMGQGGNAMKTVFAVDDDGLVRDTLERSVDGLSHDLRTPLTALKIALDGLRASCADGNTWTASKLIDISKRNIDRVIRIVEDELELLRNTLTPDPVSQRLVRLQEIIRSAARVANRGTERERMVAGSTRDVYVFTDPDRLQAVMEHILTRGGAEVLIEVLEEAPEIAISFTLTQTGHTDSGKREPAHHETISAEVDRVSGIEYHACRRIIRSLGGDVHVSLEKIVLRLPAAPEVADAIGVPWRTQPEPV